MREILDAAWLALARRLLKLTLWAWKKQASPVRQMPAGIPGNRDPEAICESYDPRPRRDGDWDGCATDGHYLCAGCCHRERITAEEAENGGWV